MAPTSQSPGLSSDPNTNSGSGWSPTWARHWHIAQYERQTRELENRARDLELVRAGFDVNDLMARLGPGRTTPRTILIAQIQRRSFPASLPENHISEQREFSQSYSLRDLTVKSLDITLDADAVILFAKSLCASKEKDPNGGLCFVCGTKQCAVCRVVKLSVDPRLPSPILQKLNEFPSETPWIRPAALCSQSICSNCLLNAITASIKTGLFHDLDRSMWFRCPINGCDEFMPITHSSGVWNVLRRLGFEPKDVETKVEMYQRAAAVRNALRNAQPRPSVPALEVSAALHAHLASRNVIKSFFDPCFPSRSTTPEEEGRLVEFTADPVKMLPVDIGTNRLLVPLLPKFFKRKPVAAARRCKGCFESWCEIDYGSLDKWIETCKPFPGSWMWRILAFSEMLAVNCGHESEYCTGCLADYIKADMDGNGYYTVDNIRCPSDGCGRTLTYEEIQCYVDPETKERYDKLLQLKSTSQLPNFRWCLRGECGNGQTFEPKEVKEDLPVRCRECQFAMCFSHQVAWHQGMTCKQYDSHKGHVDPALNGTQRWMQQNTKRCPGTNCGIPIVKGNGCFHMTCPNCHFEFCWECLTDWSLIYPEDGDSQREAHDEGCFFRTNTDSISPFDLDGSTIDQALEGLFDGEEEYGLFD